MKIELSSAQTAASICCGENAPNLSLLNSDNVISIRNRFLDNVKYNGARSHKDIILVLNYMTPFIEN